MNLRQAFAVNLRRLRHEKGMSQEDLAYEAEVDRSYLSQLEKGQFYVSLRIVERLTKALAVDATEFFKAPPKRKSR
jgi:transcriptional regulator with XRE-family HTH domain